MTILSRITDYLEKANTISDKQNAFRVIRRKEDNLFVFRTMVDKFRINKQFLYILFVDFKKAFDRVIRQHLWQRMEHMGLFGRNVDVIKEIYNRTKTKIKLSQQLSEYIGSVLGVRQGDPLSPMLFTIFINEFEKFMEENGVGLEMAGMLLSCLLFADDILLFADSAEKLQRASDCLEIFCRKMNLEVGLGNKKTEYMIIKWGSAKAKDIDLTFGGLSISRSSQYCYVGTQITDNGKFHEHISERINKASKAANMVRRWGWKYPEYTQKQLYDIYRCHV